MRRGLKVPASTQPMRIVPSASRAPARLDDVLDVTVQVTRFGQASLTIAQQARRAAADRGEGSDELLAEGTIRIGCVELETFRPCRIPSAILLAIQ